jgi:hypothetical protein
MDERITQVAGTASVLGGLLTLLVSVPPRWYGVRETDSYVFDPELFSSLWISRTVVPALSLLAVIGLLVGLAVFVRRDWSAYSRLRRWSSVPTLLGFVSLGLATTGGVVLAGNQSGTDVIGALFVLMAGGFGALLFVPGAIGFGYGYVRSGKHVVGAGLVAVPVLVPVLAYVGIGPASGLLTVLPIGITWLLLGRDLLQSASAD